MTPINVREVWLNRLATAMAPKFEALGHPIPSHRVSCGFTSKGSKSRRIGECWSASCSKDAHHEIFINPVLADSLEVAQVVCHELIHAAVGLQHKHAGDFKTMALAMGLAGKMTSTHAGPAFIAYITPILAEIGDYPHATLSHGDGFSSTPKSRSGKLLKFRCESSGYTVYITKTWFNEMGLSKCPCCRNEMVEC